MRAVWGLGRNGQDRLAKGGHVQGNPAQIWGEQGAEGARAAPLAAKAAHNTLASPLPSLSSQRPLGN